MLNFMSGHKNKSERGYIALLATIIITISLLSMVAEESLAGMHARFNAIGFEEKEEARALAEGCLQYAVGDIGRGSFSQSTTTLQLKEGTCTLYPLSLNPDGKASVHVRAQVGDSFASVGERVVLSGMYADHALSNPPIVAAPTVVVQNSSYQEVPSWIK